MRQIHSVSLTERCLSINADSSSSDGSSAGSSAATGGDRDSFLGTSESAGAGLFTSRGKGRCRYTYGDWTEDWSPEPDISTLKRRKRKGCGFVCSRAVLSGRSEDGDILGI